MAAICRKFLPERVKLFTHLKRSESLMMINSIRSDDILKVDVRLNWDKIIHLVTHLFNIYILVTCPVPGSGLKDTHVTRHDPCPQGTPAGGNPGNQGDAAQWS